MIKPLQHKNRAAGKSGKIVISAVEQEATANAEIVIFNPICQLPDSGLCFFIIYRQLSPGKYTPVYKSEIKNQQAGGYRCNQVQIGATDLCGDDIEREIKLEFFKSVPNGKHKLLNMLTLTLGELKEGADEYQCKKKGGNLKLEQLKVERRHSFLEYVFGGCEIDFTMAIDFTLSNGDPRDRHSLHYSDPRQNQYLPAIQTVG